ncbi:hypothetical protein GCM10009678_82020 [Actinomadura kijaniata]|uniref:Uncharacterized protein n=1 Tax=Actinomadura namibiensis TaxID=182080 RepID=A0A7W3LWX2_ACTNM|nr:hypothetical protein [Actinomadura namibiensis]MBA8955820.1 hypothetical protein [Actinomadura namibiensis]
MTEQVPDRSGDVGRGAAEETDDSPYEDPDATREGEGAGDRPEELNPDDFE